MSQRAASQPGDAPAWASTAWPDLRVATSTASGRRIALVTLDLPDRRNAMSDAMTDSWRHVMGQLAADDELAAVVVTGAGSAFCSGGDLGWLAGEPDATVDELRTRMSQAS